MPAFSSYASVASRNSLWNSPNLFGILTISNRYGNPGKHDSGTVVLGYTVSCLVVRRLPALNVLDLKLCCQAAA